MAHTDKDEPYWVRIRYTGLIDHDHRRGVCIVDDDRRNRWSAWRHHWRNCAKRVAIKWECTKAEPYRAYGPRYDWYYSHLETPRCWSWVCGCAIPDSWKRELHGCTDRVRTQCLGHTRIETRPEIPCVCDDKPEPTCFPRESLEERYSCFGGGGVPREYVRAVWHGPERQRERVGLREAAARWNAGDDLEDFDFVNRQARSSARWLYH
jgi:hypothetical protein